MPTRRGIGVLVAGLLLAGVGYPYGYPGLVALGAVAVAAFLAALLFAGAPPALRVRRVVDPDRVVRDEPCLAVVDVRSTARWRRQTLLGVERLRYRGRYGEPAGEVPVPPIRLRPGERTFLRYPLPTHRRGVVEVGPMELARRDPLGLVAARRRYGGAVPMWVHPRSHPVRGVPVGASRSLDGVVDAAEYGSITFHALREYVPGDDLRHVHWRTSAHIGELMVRQHVETSLPRIVVLLDDRASAYPGGATTGGGDFEQTCEAAASVLLAALRAELHVELHLVSGRAVTPRPGGHLGAGPYLDLLTEAELTPEASLPAAVQRLRARHRGDTLVLLTGTGPAATAAPGAPSGPAPPSGPAVANGGANGRADLEQVGLLRDVYPTVVAGVLGEGSLRLGRVPGVIVIPAVTAEQFAPRWDGVSRW